MSSPRELSAATRRLLDLARHDRPAARAQLARLSVEEQVALVCDSPLRRRAELLGLVSVPEEVIPAIPPAELCFIAKSVGLESAGWLLEHATEEQIATAIDLDGWSGLVPEPRRVGAWLATLADAGEETLLRTARALDFELLVLALRARMRVLLVGRDESEDLPAGGHSLDGQFYLYAHEPGDDLADALGLLGALFQHDYWLYHRLLHAVGGELDAESEEMALRWRSGRLQDLGFPPLDDARRIYSFLRPDQLERLPSERAPAASEWLLPVWMPQLPVAPDEGPLLFRALAALEDSERRPLLFAFLALVNRVAVADELPLGDAESLPAATRKAAEVASQGLAHLTELHRLEPAEVLRRATLERLFTVGANLDRDAVAPREALPEDEGPAEASPPRAPTDPEDPDRL